MKIKSKKPDENSFIDQIDGLLSKLNKLTELSNNKFSPVAKERLSTASMDLVIEILKCCAALTRLRKNKTSSSKHHQSQRR